MALPAFDVPVCRVCGAVAHARFAHCFCCATLVRQLQMPLTPVVAMADYRVGDPMHRRLRGYKDAPVAEARRACAVDLAGLVRRWMTAGRADLEARFGSTWDLVATVPSSGRPVGVPVDALVAHVPDLARRHRQLLVRGPEPTGHLPRLAAGVRARARGRPGVAPGQVHPRLRRQHHHRCPVPECGRGPASGRRPRRGGHGRGPGGGRSGGGQPDRGSARPGRCCSASSPSPSRAPPTTSCWPWPGRPRPRASTPSSAATTTWPWALPTACPDPRTPGSPWPPSPARPRRSDWGPWSPRRRSGCPARWPSRWPRSTT